ncbi:MAG: hypothetical protein ACI89E_001971, partial [Planctomycetota bacterium]
DRGATPFVHRQKAGNRIPNISIRAEFATPVDVPFQIIPLPLSP